MITLTTRHSKVDRLATLWDGVAKGWDRVTRGKGWQRNRDEFGVVGYLRVIEVTLGRNGWHVHVHALVFSEPGLTVDRLNALGQSMFGRWSAGVQSVGLRAPLPVGSEWHIVTDDIEGTSMGRYFAKLDAGMSSAGAIGMELTQTQSKTARTVHSTRAVWSLLDEGVLEGEAVPLRLWHEWERASKGRRQIATTRGLRELLGIVAVEKTDEEIAAEVLGRREDTVAWITRAGWAVLVRRPHLIEQVLTTVENGGQAALSEFLTANGVEFQAV
jgi:hypothetical protein